jgi:diamine N-acetyltransferase
MMTLENDNIKLRAPELSDLDVLYKWENDDNLWHLSNTQIPFSKFDLEQFILNGNHDIYSEKQYRFMIEDTKNKTLVGCVDIFDFEPLHRRAGIGIIIDADHRKKGFASMALDILIEYASQHLNLHQLYCNILSSNTRSIFLFKKKQFSIIGVKKDWVFLNEHFQDEILMQLMI